MLPKFCNKSFTKFLRDVFPELPVIAIIFAFVFSLFLEAKLLRNLISLTVFKILFLFLLIFFEDTIYFAPFFNA